MTKTHRKDAGTADEAFHRHYASIWGPERWKTSLYPALLEPTRHACLLNRYTSLEESRSYLKENGINLRELALPPLPSSWTEPRPNCFVRDEASGQLEQKEATSSQSEASLPAPKASSLGLLMHWNLDAASILVARILDVQPGDNVLDLCAAPGGKSIALAQRVWPHMYAYDKGMELHSLRIGSLHSNEADGPRYRRLGENLRAYLPKPLFESSRVAALRVDASKPNAGFELRVKTNSGTTGYDKVLVDAPCSSERHIIHAHAKARAAGHAADEMTHWRPGSSKRLAKTQMDLLMTGLKAANVGATVVYATCSIEPTENDEVVDKVLAQIEKERKKGVKWTVKVGFNGGKGDEALEAELEKEWAERTKHGWIILPDHPAGGKWGPLFFAILTKSGS